MRQGLRAANPPLRLRAVIVLLAAARTLLLAGCGAHQHYTRGEVERAFAQHRFELVVAARRIARGKEAILAPRTGESFLVLVSKNDDDAKKAIATLGSERTSESFDRREGNVVVTSDTGITAAIAKRIDAALATLGTSR